MSLDYNTVWKVMNDLDEVVQRTKIINDMCDSMRKTVYDWTDADEVIDEIEALRSFSKYILRDLDNKAIIAWNETVHKLNKYPKKRVQHNDLDSLDGWIGLPDDCVAAATTVSGGAGQDVISFDEFKKEIDFEDRSPSEYEPFDDLT